MELKTALAVQPGITAIIGAGGKSTLLLALGRELARTARVILCTTTHIYPPEGVVCLSAPSRAELQAALERERLVCVGSPTLSGKLTAPPLPPEVLAAEADYVLVEADGAHGRPAKAHAAHEPVVPAGAGQTILVFGLTALGRPIAVAVHRPQLFAAAMGVSEQEILTPELAAAFLNRETAHTRVLLHQADAPGCEQAGRRMAALLCGPVCLGAIEKEWMICLF